nr:14088_t:CDS:2 [Entrophospora candida]CAG8484477.1 12972_t:CDS:2 [Entrophospora candida]
MRPDVSCLVDKIAILNSEIKPLGFTPFQQLKDKIKVQIRARESINQMSEAREGPLEATFFTDARKLLHKLAYVFTCANNTLILCEDDEISTQSFAQFRDDLIEAFYNCE